MSGVLILFVSALTVIMQPLPQLPGAVCVAKFGAATATCYRPAKRVKGTSGYVAQRFTISLQVKP